MGFLVDMLEQRIAEREAREKDAPRPRIKLIHMRARRLPAAIDLSVPRGDRELEEDPDDES